MSYLTPDFEGPRKTSGSAQTPDIAPRGPVGPVRGKYPKDGGGPPETKVGDKGPSGDPYGLTGMDTHNEDHQPPAQSPRFVARRDV